MFNINWMKYLLPSSGNTFFSIEIVATIIKK
jgi:hypothetical protein